MRLRSAVSSGERGDHEGEEVASGILCSAHAVHDVAVIIVDWFTEQVVALLQGVEVVLNGLRRERPASDEGQSIPGSTWASRTMSPSTQLPLPSRSSPITSAWVTVRPTGLIFCC